MMIQADGGILRTKRGYAHGGRKSGHRYLKRAYHRTVRRRVKAILARDEEPPRNFKYRGYEL